MTDDRAEAALRRQERLAERRAVWESHWREIAERVLPRQADFDGDRPAGAKRTDKIFDSTAPLALERFAAAMEGMLTPRAQRWHHLRAGDTALNDRDDVRRWFARAEDALFQERYSPEANYASQQHEVYMSLGAFGSGVLFVGETARGGVRYRAIHLAECYFDEDSQGRIDTAFRRFRLNARQAAQEWGADALPPALRRALDQEPDRRFEFVHAVFPRAGKDKAGGGGAEAMAFVSRYVSLEGRALVHEGGFEEFPYAISRYVTAPREVYGRSPAMQVLADIKMLNEMARTTLRAAHKAVDPPLLVADDGVMSRINTRPNALNFGGLGSRGQALVQPLATGANVPLGLEMENQRRRVINDAFLVTLFQILVEQPAQTATEALIRAQEKGVMLSPTLGRQQAEALGPMIAREVGILLRAGRLPRPPDALLADGDIEIEYASPLSRAQRAEEAVGVMRVMEAAGALAQVDPGVFDHLDTDAAIRAVAEAHGAGKLLRGRDEIAARRADRERANALDQFAAAAPSLAGALKDTAAAGAAARDLSPEVAGPIAQALGGR